MDVDKLFKLPNVPHSALNKRKWGGEPSRAALQAVQKKGGEEEEDGQNNSPFRVSKAARVSTDEEKEEAADEEFAPGNDADYFVDEDDDGGRFFGGGLTAQQKRILEIMNRGDNEEDEKEIAAKAEDQLRTFRKSLVRLERAINKNQEMRMRFNNEPAKYIDSEADLDAAIKSLVVSTTNPPFFYPEMIKHGTTASLCSLLSHENIDITAATIELLEEMTDDDVLDAGMEGRTEEEQESNQRKGEECMVATLESLLQQSLIELLVQNLSRLKEEEEEPDLNGNLQDERSSLLAATDMSTIYHLLGLLENLVSLRPTLAVTLMGHKPLLQWLLHRISRKGSLDQNKAYAGELLGILVQVVSSQADSRDDSLRSFGAEQGISQCLEVLSAYRKREPQDDEEAEFMENVIDVLCTALTLEENKERFLEEEGTELMCLLLKGKGLVRLRAVKTLNHALSGPYGSHNCSRFVDINGLKALFAAFMGKGNTSSHYEPTAQDEEHILEIFTSLFNNLASDSMQRSRFVAKFVENDFEKVDRLLEVRETLRDRLKPFEALSGEGEEMEEEAQLSLYMERIEHGLYSLQLLDYTLAWLVMELEEEGIVKHIQMLDSRRGGTLLIDVIETLKDYYFRVGEHILVDLPQRKGEEGLRLKDVIVNLVNYLLGVAE